MAPASAPRSARKAASPTRGQRILAALVSGASVETIAKDEGSSPRRIEKILRDELRRRWVIESQDVAKLQIARLEAMIVKLLERAQEGELGAIDRVLKILDRLDRYYGFGRAPPAPAPYDDNARERLLAKLNRVAIRLKLGPPEG
jgi:hypothetical protein